ncbi:hypothetical protein AHAS_Ahas18G0127700 [Arachis hypogaea]
MEYQYVVRHCRSTETREYSTRPYPVKTNNNSTRGEAGFVKGECSSGAEWPRQRDSVILTQSLLLLGFSTENLTALIVVTASVVSLLISSLPTFTALVVVAAEPVTVVFESVATFLLSPSFSR